MIGVPPRRKLLLAVSCWLVFMFGSLAANGSDWKPHYPAMPLHQDYGGPFELVDHHGNRFTEKQLLGRFTLVYFGYTSCPDICAVALNTIAISLDSLDAGARKISPVFVNLDHERQDLAALREYVGFFHENMIGTTGTAAQLRAISGAYGVRFKHAHNHDGDRMTTHSGMIFLIGPDGKARAMLPHDVPQEWLDATLNEHLDKKAGG